MWTVTEGTAAGTLSLTCYSPQDTPGGGVQWRILRSFAGVAGIAAESTAQQIQVHLLPAAEALALVTRSGVAVLVSISEASAPPQHLHLVRTAPPELLPPCVDRQAWELSLIHI